MFSPEGACPSSCRGLRQCMTAIFCTKTCVKRGVGRGRRNSRPCGRLEAQIKLSGWSAPMVESIMSVDPTKNCLLNAVPVEERERLVPMLEHVTFSLGQVIYESGRNLEYIYFPTTSVVSLLYTMENGMTAEIGLTGNDGGVGIALFLGGD